MKLIPCQKITSGKLSEGCRQCIMGRKSVLFVTGICHYRCFYCPISDDKRFVDIVKINEHIITDADSQEGIKQLITECILCQSTGIGITGGDPLAKLDRTCTYIKALKKQFGKSFHTHLYTPLDLVSKRTLSKLQDAGLDEIRFHPDVENEKLWEKIKLVKEYSFTIGLEIPVIPGKLKETKKLLDYFHSFNFVEFTNLNELEFSDISLDNLTSRGFYVKNQLSYGIKQSEEDAKELVKYGEEKGYTCHYCSAGFKDGVQLGNRFLLRAQKVALPLDIVDEEGLLMRGVVEGPDVKNMYDILHNKYEVDKELLFLEEYVDKKTTKTRLLVASSVLEEIWSELKTNTKINIKPYCASINVEYPTDDHFLVEKTVL